MKQLFLKNLSNGIEIKAKAYFLSYNLNSFFFIEDKLGKGKYGTVILLRNPRNSIPKEELMEGAFWSVKLFSDTIKKSDSDDRGSFMNSSRFTLIVCLLFHIYISASKVKFHLFGDDTYSFRSNKKLFQLKRDLNISLEKIFSLLKANKVTLKNSKRLSTFPLMIKNLHRRNMLNI